MKVRSVDDLMMTTMDTTPGANLNWPMYKHHRENRYSTLLCIVFFGSP